MSSGFDKYFQIAPCFRDEDARADRSPGEFYQLDFEMSFVTQEDVFEVGEEVLHDTFEKFAPEGSRITETPFPIISYKQAMLEFGCDKPDLRNPDVYKRQAQRRRDLQPEDSFRHHRTGSTQDRCVGKSI